MKQCNQCKQNFDVTDADRKFYERIDVPEPTLCFTCRMRRRLNFRNDRSLYHDKCALTGKKMISMYDPKLGYTVYDQEAWWSDKWDPFEYGRDFDFNRPFFEQFAELHKVVPRFNLFNRDTENCEYVNYAPHCRNCYLTFGSWFNENCHYGQTYNECKDCVDNLFLDKSELCYENIDGNNNYASVACQNCANTSESYFCFDCKDVKNCIGCWNLRNKQYHIANKPATKEEYEKARKDLASYAVFNAVRKHFGDMLKKNAICQAITGLSNQNVSGDFIFYCKNVIDSFSVYRCEDIAFCGRAIEQKDSYDFDGGGKSEFTYEAMSNDFSYHSISCMTCEHMVDAHYCDHCFNCENCIGCIGLRYKKYCIFNKQYKKEEYEKLAPKIIEHMKKTKEWGEFFPIWMSPFAFNETQASEYLPLEKNEAVKQGYKWKEEERKKYQPQTYEIPDVITDVPDEITDELLACENCKKNFKIIQQELNFYRKIGLPVPHNCPDCRHFARMAKRNKRELFNRKCDKCGTAIRTAYRPDRPEKIYCEKCYLKEVY